MKGDLELTSIIHNTRHNYIRKQLNSIFYIIIASIVLSAGVLNYFYLQPSSNIDTQVLLVSYALFGITIIGLDQARKNSPKNLHSLEDWLDWKLFGIGESRFAGRKVFILTALGLLVGALFNNAGLGLVIGLILGASMEYSS